MKDWLKEFVEYGTCGEATPRILYWVGVSTIAAALRRKVWFDQDDYQWSPNFYVLLVGPPGAIRKSTSIDIGMRLLKRIDGINLGPAIVTWQALIQYIAEKKEEWKMETGEIFEMSSVTLPISEFGSFFDPENRELVDNLTDLWDGKLGTIEKITKTAGSDVMVNPWINLIAATTPKWLAKHFGEELVGGGLAGRFIYLYGEKPDKRVAYPKRQMPTNRYEKRVSLITQLQEFAQHNGPMELTEEAYEWGELWYDELQEKLQTMGSGSLEYGFFVRKQVHLHKLAMVIAVARGEFPLVTLDCMKEAERQLNLLEGDTKRVFGYVGQNKVTQAAAEIVAIINGVNSYPRRQLYKDKFFRTMSIGEFDEAVRSAIQAELIVESDGAAFPVLSKRKQ